MAMLMMALVAMAVAMMVEVARYRDPRPEELVMFLHALKYSVSHDPPST